MHDSEIHPSAVRFPYDQLSPNFVVESEGKSENLNQEVAEWNAEEGCPLYPPTPPQSWEKADRTGI